MKKEIGGYFELESLINNPWYSNNIKLNSGRAALLLIIQTYNINKIFLPYFLCDSVKNYLYSNRPDIEIIFYNIDNNFLPKIRSIDNSFLYIVNYYGLISNEIILEYKEKYKNIIVDNTQAFFQPPLPNIPTLYSCRKYFGIPDGSYLFCDDVEIDSIKRIKIKNYLKPLIARSEECASDYYIEHIECEKRIEEQPIQLMSNFSENILGAINYKNIIEKRNSNFSYLKRQLSYINELTLLNNIIPNGPFCYPLLIKDAKNLKKTLINNKIYIPTLWPNVINENDKFSIEYQYAKNILPIPCDQRYNNNDMKIISNIINENKE